MKNLYLSAAILLTFSGVAQTTFQVKNEDNNTIVANNITYSHSTSASLPLEHHFEIRNIGTVSQTLEVRKYEDEMNQVSSTDKSEAYFCTGLICYQPNVFSAPVELAPNETLSLKAYFNEATVPGASTVRYRVTNIDNSEVLTFSFRYTPQSTVTAIADLAELTNNLLVYPNPAGSVANLSLNSPVAGNGTLHIRNQLGMEVITREIIFDATSSNYQLDTTTLPAGIYSVSLETITGTTSKQLVIVK
jgi:hypothetical protein